MTFKSVALGLLVEDEQPPSAVMNYAVAFCDAERAHLSCKLIAPILDLPTGRLVPLAKAVVDQVNDDRLKKAGEVEAELTIAARVSGVTIACSTLQKPYAVARAELITAARSSDIVILPQTKGILS